MVTATQRKDEWWSLKYRYDDSYLQIIRSVPNYARSWDALTKEWHISDDWYRYIAVKLRSNGFIIKETPYQREQNGNHGQGTYGNATWTTAMFNALPPRLHEPVWKALMRVCHPDANGDTLVSQQLNDAYDKVRKR